MNKQINLSDYSKFKATGILTNGKRFNAIHSTNWFYIDGINLYHGNKWGLNKTSGKWELLQTVYN